MRLPSLLIFAALSALSTGCAAPGSAIGQLGISGTIMAATGEQPNSVVVTLPKSYGLGTVDSYFGKPEDYGRDDEMVTAEVKEGSFSVVFPPVAYHVTVWFLPPLGMIPKYPPSPVYQLYLSNAPDEVYLVGVIGDELRYCVFDKESRVEKGMEEATWRIFGGKFMPENIGENEIWFSMLSFEKQRSVIRGVAASRPCSS